MRMTETGQLLPTGGNRLGRSSLLSDQPGAPNSTLHPALAVRSAAVHGHVGRVGIGIGIGRKHPGDTRGPGGHAAQGGDRLGRGHQRPDGPGCKPRQRSKSQREGLTASAELKATSGHAGGCEGRLTPDRGSSWQPRRDPRRSLLHDGYDLALLACDPARRSTGWRGSPRTPARLVGSGSPKRASANATTATRAQSDRPPR